MLVVLAKEQRQVRILLYFSGVFSEMCNLPAFQLEFQETKLNMPGLSAHPHLSLWKQTGGLVVDGVVFARAHAEAKIKGEPVVLVPSASAAAAGEA